MASQKQPSISSYFSNASRPPTLGRATEPQIIDLTELEDTDAVKPPMKKRKVMRRPESVHNVRACTSKINSDDEKNSSSRNDAHPSTNDDTEKRKMPSFKPSATTIEGDEFLPEARLRQARTLSSEHNGIAKPSEADNLRKVKKRSIESQPQNTDSVGERGLPWTPLERQVSQLKSDYPDVVLLIQDGYKYRFFGEDAKVASRELGIVCYPRRNFLSASIPIERKPIHVKKLISQGYKVGIVDQQETAALKKVGDNRSGLFKRGLSALYTAATYVDSLDSTDASHYAEAAFPSLMCLVELPLQDSQNVHIGMVSVVPSTGDVVYDCFNDGPLRMELDTRLVHLKPHEILSGEIGMSKETRAILRHFANAGNATGSLHTRFETFQGEPMSYSDAVNVVQAFHESRYTKTDETSNIATTSKWIASIMSLPQLVSIAIAHCVKHLSNFGLANAFSETQVFRTFESQNSMLLNGNTITNLEIFRNQSDFTTRGSLFWLLDHTKTKFGSRMLKDWVARPLINMVILAQRFEAIDEILGGSSPILSKLEMILKGLPDLNKGLARVQYKQSTPKELATILTAFRTASIAFEPCESPAGVGLASIVLNDVIYSLSSIRPLIQNFIGMIDITKARSNTLVDLWTDENKFPEVTDAKTAILFIESDLQDHLKEVRKFLRRPTLQYKSISGFDYLIELPKSGSQDIPASWSVISKTKKDVRYHTPEIREKLRERDQCQEILDAAAATAFSTFLGEIGEHYATLRGAVNNLAIADCLFSMAQVALQSGYVKPNLTEEDSITIINGRHPVVEAIRPEPFVPNSVSMGGKSTCTKIITGPNMGGKSSYVRMTALLCIMAQVGSYVPAEVATLGMVDSVLTRMGASDDLSRGKSTFMVELSETSDILRHATSRSLVILDELGRGTSTFDGMAIASAVLQYVVQEIKCKTMFITHYPAIAENMERRFHQQVENAHMGFLEEDQGQGRAIHFLYTLSTGVATGSFGVECARLAGLPENVLRVATVRSKKLQDTIGHRTKSAQYRMTLRRLQSVLDRKPEARCMELAELRDLTKSILAS